MNRYTIYDRYGSDDFTIDAVTGIVKLAKELDFEDWFNRSLDYKLRVVAHEDEESWESSIELEFHVTDVND